MHLSYLYCNSMTEPVACGYLDRASSSLANVSAISTTHINDTALTIHRDTSALVPQSSNVIGQQKQPIVDLDSIDLAGATREPFLDGCKVRKTHILMCCYPHMPKGSLFVFCVGGCVCMVADFSAEDKASGIKFCMVVHRRPGQGISHFGELFSPRSPKSDESAILGLEILCRKTETDVQTNQRC